MARLAGLRMPSAYCVSACLVAAMPVSATRSLAVIRTPASIPESSASSCESCSLACTVAIRPMAWPSWLVSDSLLAMTRNSLGSAAMPWL